MNTISIPRLGVNASDENTGILPRYNLRTHRVPDLPAPLSEDNVRRFTREFYCRVILPLAAKTGMAWGRTETWLRKTAEKFKQITKRTFDAYIAELLSCGWIEYQIDDRGNLAVNPLYCPPAATDRRAAGYAPPDSWVRESSAAKVFSARISAESSTKTPGFCSPSSYSIREDLEKENLLTKTDSVPVPSPVVGSLALQKEKENAPTNETQDVLQPRKAPNTYPSQVSVPAADTKRVPADAGKPSHIPATPKPLDLPAAAAQLVSEGKVAAKIILRHIRRASREVVGTACAAVIEISQKEPIRCYERAICSAVGEEWKPSDDFALPYNPGSVSADYVKPAPDALAAEWPGASEKRLHRSESQFSSTEGRMVRCAGKHRALVMRMVNWIFREPQGRADDDAEWVAVARLVVAAGSYLHLPMDWEAPRMEGVTGN